MADIVIEAKDGTKLTIPQSVADTFGDKISASIKKAKKEDPPPRKPPTDDRSLLDFGGAGQGKMFPQLEVLKPFMPEVMKDKLEALENKFDQFTVGPARKLHDFFRNFDGDIRPFYANIQEVFGGIPITGERATNKLSAQMQDAFDNIFDDATKFKDNLNEANIVLELDTGDSVKKVNLIDNALGGAQQVLQDFNSLIQKNANTLGPKFAEALEGQEYQITRFNRGLGLSQQQITTLLSRQIALTGEASTQMLEDIQTQSFAIADAVGGNAKLIAQQTADIIGDVKNFGNVTVEEAGRMAAAMQSAGIEFSAFTNMLGKFQNFDSATRAMSDLTAVFGVHMDTMELMQLANEDQEEFMFRIKEGFETQGLAMEDMNLAQKRILADTMGINVQQAELFFAEGALPDQAEMEQASLTANAEEAVKRLNQDIKNLVHEKGSIDEVVTEGVNEAFTRPLQKAAYRNANIIRTGAAAISTELKAAGAESGKKMKAEFVNLASEIQKEGALTAGAATNFLGGIITNTESGITAGMTGVIKNTKQIFIDFKNDWWDPNMAPSSPSKFFGMPLYLGLMAGIYKVRDDIKPEFTKIAQGASEVITNTGLPKILKELTETAEIATGVAAAGTSDLSQNIETLNTAAADNLPKMVEKLEELNTLLTSHVQKIQEGTDTNLKVALSLDTREIYESLYNYKHPSGGTVKFNTGKT